MRCRGAPAAAWAALLVITALASLSDAGGKGREEKRQMPWIFSYNGWSPSYDHMMKTAVTSALATGALKPYCLFSGDEDNEVYQWMAKRGVEIIIHRPAWGKKLWDLAAPFAEQNMKHSHLYANNETLIGTWQRIDIPIIPAFQQYEYVLFADTDVLFRPSTPLLELLDQHKPTAVAMGPEITDAFPYNAGVMVMNIPFLRDTYQAFLEFILSNKHGLYFPGFGPGDQGAYNEFYEKHIRAQPLSKKLNAKPYHEYDPYAAIVHFHGPKFTDYVGFFELGTCRFGDLCERGVRNAFCRYALDWVLYCSGAPECNRVHAMCRIITVV